VRKHIMLRDGVKTDLYFVKTPNTVTLRAGPGQRDIQIITRLYESTSQVLNTFDIDCCCVGFDGSAAMITPRAVVAINTKVNTINLDIRGACYEHRLMKYAERGFSIGVPLLERKLIPESHLEWTFSNAYGYDTISGDGWSRLSEAENLSRLVAVESLTRQTNGYLEFPFPGRQRKLAHDEGSSGPMAYNIQPNAHLGVRDEGYGGAMEATKNRAGRPIWPATTQLSVFTTEQWKLTWRPGNMPRRPLTWEEWSKSAYDQTSSPHDWKNAREERLKLEEKERQEKEAARMAELHEARVEARKEADEHHKRASEEAAKVKAMAEQQTSELELLRTTAKEKESVETELSVVTDKLAELEQASENLMCIICLDQPRRLLLEPCRHVCICITCGNSVDTCPLCRVKIQNKTTLFM